MSRLRLAGLVLTSLLVLVLLGSFVAGLGRGGGAGDPAAPDTVPGEPGAGRVRVEVLNAAGVPGLARDVTDHLRDRGIDVVFFGNARGFGGDTTLVLDRVGDEAAALRVAEALGLGAVRAAPDSGLYVDVSVIVGRDWRGR